MIFKRYSAGQRSRHRSLFLRRAAARKRTYEQVSKEKKECGETSSEKRASSDRTGSSTPSATS